MEATVIQVISARTFIDGVERVVVRVEEADAMFREFRVRNTSGWRLNEELELTLESVRERSEIDREINNMMPAIT